MKKKEVLDPTSIFCWCLSYLIGVFKYQFSMKIPRNRVSRLAGLHSLKQFRMQPERRIAWIKKCVDYNGFEIIIKTVPFQECFVSPPISESCTPYPQIFHQTEIFHLMRYQFFVELHWKLNKINRCTLTILIDRCHCAQ